MSLRASLFLVSVLLFQLTIPSLCATIRAGDDTIATTNEDQELPVPISLDMELPPPLPQPEVVSASYASSVLDPEAKRIRLPSPKVWVGAKLSSDQPRVISVVSDSPAAMAGLVEGDVFDSVNYRHVNRASDVVNVLRQNKPGEIVDIIVVRSNVRRSCSFYAHG